MRGLAVERITRPRPGQDRKAPIPVAACIVRDGAGRVLLAQRRPDQMSGGFWEIPGGKIEPGESPSAAAQRETWEETGIETGGLRPILRYAFRFPTRTVDLSFFEASTANGQAVGREGQAVAWVDPAAPHGRPILASNIRVMRLLSLAQRVMCACPPQAPRGDWGPSLIDRARAADATAVLLQVRSLVPAQQLALAQRLGPLLARAGLAMWLDAAPGVVSRSRAAVGVFRPGEPHGAAPAMLRATWLPPYDTLGPDTLGPDTLGAGALQGDFILQPMSAQAPLLAGLGRPVVAVTGATLAPQALAAGAFGICLSDAGDPGEVSAGRVHR